MSRPSTWRVGTEPLNGGRIPLSKLAAAIAANQPKFGTPCPVAEVLAGIGKPADRKELVDALADRSIAHVALCAAVEHVFGRKVGYDAMGKHRRNQCRCARG